MLLKIDFFVFRDFQYFNTLVTTFSLKLNYSKVGIHITLEKNHFIFIMISSNSRNYFPSFIKNFARTFSLQSSKFSRHESSNAKPKSNNYERFLQNKLYIADGPEFLDDQHVYQDKMVEYNRTFPTEVDKRASLLPKIFAEVGKDCVVETPINANWGCKHVHLGNYVYINSNVTFVDDDQIYIGDYTMIAPNVMFTTAGHPILPSLRLKGYQFNFPIHLGKNVWIGSGVQIMPGVTIGDNSFVGAGSVVTKDIPANCVAMGIPCRVIREIGEKDKKYYHKKCEIDIFE